jgi:hypothetical protein
MLRRSAVRAERTDTSLSALGHLDKVEEAREVLEELVAINPGTS